MARAALPGRLSWQLGRVVETIQETQRATSLVLDLSNWPGHRAGQHVDIRLTAEDRYQAQRGYSIASAPEDDGVMLTVNRLEAGEVSPYLTDVVEAGDEIEVRGPIGGYFVWDASLSGPLQLISGGSGIVPLRAMLRHWAAARPPVKVRLLHSARSLDDVIYRDELMRFAAFDEVDLHIALTRTWGRPARRSHPVMAGALARAPRARRPRLSRERDMASGGRAAHLRLRTNRLRRGRNRCPGRERPAARRD
jgi:ferredoxin-NADP reductase